MEFRISSDVETNWVKENEPCEINRCDESKFNSMEISKEKRISLYITTCDSKWKQTLPRIETEFKKRMRLWPDSAKTSIEFFLQTNRE